MTGQSLPLGTTSNQNGEIQFKKLPFEETSPGSRKPNNRERIIQGQMGPHRSVYRDQLDMISDIPKKLNFMKKVKIYEIF